ncbi:NLPA lipoprotein [Brevibacterium mcbrellneri ATCC 49030]|uniref:Lipoprotein n=1 Tax=Brevibacterium mcbrellneri ATCC 49030 TaxID=585530 RepID=D4YPK7_9MICO|nr:MetQ/NlpA family ABC transporter substrate-binding protein [Brevibacterium mcbrellneri]EFG46868.1 NLPA lipoprotein [Brevibacterium mcbrellneri ATCC 49030]
MKLRIAAAVAAASLLLTGCGLAGGDAKEVGKKNGDITTLTVGVSPVPHGDILKFVDENLAKDAGLDIEIKEYTDYTLPNRALVDGDLDANYFQHKPYLDTEVEGQGYKIHGFEGVHIEPIALFSKKVKSVDELPDGGTIGINNDPANQGRALDMLAKEGVITLADGKDATTATIHDIKDNPKNLKFQEADAAQLARTLDDTDASIINGNNALEAGLSPTKDSILVESAENNPYANFLAVRDGDQDNESIKKLDELLHSPEVKKYIEDTWTDGAVLPAF